MFYKKSPNVKTLLCTLKLLNDFSLKQEYTQRFVETLLLFCSVTKNCFNSLRMKTSFLLMLIFLFTLKILPEIETWQTVQLSLN